jgi:hypothetical protein
MWLGIGSCEDGNEQLAAIKCKDIAVSFSRMIEVLRLLLQ